MSAKLRALELAQQEKSDLAEVELTPQVALSQVPTSSLFPSVPPQKVTYPSVAESYLVPTSSSVNVSATVTLNGCHSKPKVFEPSCFELE